MIKELEHREELANRVKDVVTHLVTDYIDLITYTVVSDERLLSLECSVNDLTCAIERYKKEMGDID